MQYASLTTKSSPLPNFGKSKMFQHFLQPCSLPKNWLALITMTRQQNMAKMEGLKFDYQLTNMKPFLIQTVRNGCPTLENHLEKPSDNFWVAKTSFHETRMPKLNTQNSFKKMIETGHLEPVPESDHNLPPEKHFVMPNHAVWKSSSTTTKCRAVFNASAKRTNGKSLKDCLLVGPKEQPDLFEILIQFRLHRIALSGDITKMYRQIELNEKDRNFHQMYWRISQKQPIKKYRMTRVIYGVSSSSYHAIRALRDTAKDAPSIHCKNSLLNSFYVDDLLGAGDKQEQVIGLFKDIRTTLELIGMSIRKWASNTHEVIEAISRSYKKTKIFSSVNVTTPSNPWSQLAAQNRHVLLQ